MLGFAVVLKLSNRREAKRARRVTEAAAQRDRATSMLQAERIEVASRLRLGVADLDQSSKSARF